MGAEFTQSPVRDKGGKREKNRTLGYLLANGRITLVRLSRHIRHTAKDELCQSTGGGDGASLRE